MGLFSFNIATELGFVHRKINSTCVDKATATFKTGAETFHLRGRAGFISLAVRNVLRGLVIWLDFTLPSIGFVFLPSFGAFFW